MDNMDSGAIGMYVRELIDAFLDCKNLKRLIVTV